MTRNSSPLSEKQARRLMETYGGAPDLWPEDIRDALHEAIDNYPGLAATLSREKALDDKITACMPPISDGFISQITSQFEGSASLQQTLDREMLSRQDPRPHLSQQGAPAVDTARRSIWANGGLAAAALGLGLVIGSYVADPLFAGPINMATLDGSEDVLAFTSFELWTLSE